LYSLNKKSIRRVSLTHLTRSVLLACLSNLGASAYAIESISDQVLSDTTGADGMLITLQATQATLGNYFWQDGTNGIGNALALQNATLTGNSGNPVNASVRLNVGSDGATPALSMNLNLRPVLFSAPQVVLCDGVAAGSPSSCGASAGELAFQTLGSTDYTLATTGGLLNSAGTATIKLLLDRANVFITKGSPGAYNQVVTSDIYANISATGRIWVDATDGFRFSTQNAAGNNIGSVTLTPPGNPDADPTTGEWIGLSPWHPINAGYQATIGMQNNGTAATPATTLSANPNGLYTMGMSGTLSTFDLTMRGTSASGVGFSAEDNLGAVVGGAGIASRTKATLKTGTASDSFKLFTGMTGTNGYGVQTSNFVPFSNVSLAADSELDTGNIYLNLLNASTTSLQMPVPSALTNGLGAGGQTTGANNFFTNSPTSNSFPSTNTTQDVQTITGRDSLLLSIRGLSFQGVPLTTSFYKNNYGLCTGTTTCNGADAVNGFAYSQVLYGVSANLTLSPDTATSLAYSLALATVGNNGGTEGIGSTPGTLKGTSLFLADTSSCRFGSGEPCAPQYVGMRDVNIYLKANGIFDLGGDSTSNTIKITMPNFLYLISANVAAGYLPGANSSAPSPNRYDSNKDTVYTLNVGLQSDTQFFDNNQIAIIASSATPGAIGFTADLTLAGTRGTTTASATPDQDAATGNFIRMVGRGGSALGFDNVTGRLQLGAGSQFSIGPNSASTTSVLKINPDKIRGNEVLTTYNIYPSTAVGGSGQAETVAKMVLTGGTIRSNLSISPITR
jgi:hypothetical protein